MSEPTCRALCYSDADFLSGVRTYLPGTVLQCRRLFKRCQNLPARHCVTLVLTVRALSEPTCRALCCSGANCLSNVRTYLPSNVLLGCRLFKWYQKPTYRALFYSGASCLRGVGIYLPGTVLQGCRLFKPCRTYLPGTVLLWCRLFRHSFTVVQAV